MSGNYIKLANGDRWTRQQFVDHYFSARGSGKPAPVPVDMSWYMDEGPGRYYHPGMFPIVNSVSERHDLAPGAYDLWNLAPKNKDDPAVKAAVSNYSQDTFSDDYATRALVFGDESARISGKVVVNPDGSKTFKQVEIKPFDTDFDFQHNTWNPLIEIPRGLAGIRYDPLNQGAKYDIDYRGQGTFDNPFSDGRIGRVYQPFTDSELRAAMKNPTNATPGLLPSFTAAPPPALQENLQYLKQQNGDQTQAPVSVMPAAPSISSPPPKSSGSAIGDWLASLAGVDPTNPNEPQRSGIPGASANPPIRQRVPIFFGPP